MSDLLKKINLVSSNILYEIKDNYDGGIANELQSYYDDIDDLGDLDYDITNMLRYEWY